MRIYAFFLSLLPALYVASNELTIFESRLYNPTKYGLTKFQVQATVPNLQRHLKATLSFGEINQIIYRISWNTSQKVDISIEGLPEGFAQLRAQLKAFLMPYMDFIIPKKFTDRFSSYNFERTTNETGVLLKGTDKTQLRDVRAVDIQFGSNGLVEFIESMSSRGTQRLSMEYSQHPGTNNRYLITKTTTESLLGPQKVTNETAVSHQRHGSYILPSSITVTTKVSASNPESPAQESTNTLSIAFNEYKIN